MEKEIKIRLSEPIPLSDAAREFDINHLALARAAKKGTVAAQRVLERWLVERSDVEKYAETHHQRGRRQLKKLRARYDGKDGGRGKKRVGG